MALSPVSELIGRVLAGRYRLTAPVGVGASAHVFVADDVQLRRRVAVKVLHPGLAHDPTFLRRFQAEAQAAAALNHPNVLAVYDWGRDEVPFLVTEYLEGGSLQGVLDAGRLLSVSQALVVGLDAARGLHYAHSRGFVHRDVKPANLLFGDDDRRLRVADFGLARALAEASWTEPEGVVLGTARYVSPEQASGGSLDGRSDVYSLALVLVEAVTGRVPHTADTALGSLRARIGRSIEAPAELGPLGPVVEAAGRADPAQRSSAAELGRALMGAARQLHSPEPLPLAPPTLPPVPTDRGEAGGWPEGGGMAPAPSRSTTIGRSIVGVADAAAGPDITTLGPTRAFGDAQRGTSAPVAPAGPAAAQQRVAVASPGVSELTPAPPPSPVAPPEDGRPVPHGDGEGDRRGRRSSRRRRRRRAAGGRPSRVRRVGRWTIGVLLLAALATLATIGVSLLRGWGEPRMIGVPTLVGRTQSEVATLLPPEARWQVSYTDGRRDGSVPGQILSQDPPAGGLLVEGGTLRLERSVGEGLRQVPEVAQLSVEQATQRLEAAGLAVGSQQGAFDEQVPPGTVLSAAEQGRELPKGSPVTLVVSQGPAPRTIPDLAGQRPEQATAALQALGLVVAPSQDYSDETLAGSVIGTSPAAGGEPVPKGSTVGLIVSLGPRPIPVADVIGLGAVEASDRLEAQGFVVRTEGAANREVIATDPPAGTELNRGATVYIITRRT